MDRIRTISKQLFLDMDGVLSDFGTAVIRHYSLPVELYELDSWWKIIDIYCETYEGKTVNDFWNGFDYLFWVNIPKTKECDTILAMVEQYKPVLLTTCSSKRDGSSAAGKLTWIAKYLPDYYADGRYFIGASDKSVVSGENKVLIDDSQDNYNNWWRKGGEGILVPRPWNLMGDKVDVLEVIYEQLENIMEEEY